MRIVEDSDKTVQMRRLFRVFDGRTSLIVGSVVRTLINIIMKRSKGTASNRNAGLPVVTPDFWSNNAGLRYFSQDSLPFEEPCVVVGRINHLFRILGLVCRS